MPVNTVAILSPGDMGHAVGRALSEHGLDVVTCLKGRSERTRKLAEKGNLRDLPSLEELVTRSDLVLSIVPPAEAVNAARSVAEALRATGSDTPFADCNATAPQTATQAGDIIAAAGGRFIDASIIGGPPRSGGRPPRFYASGSHAGVLAELDGKGIEVCRIGDVIGSASGLKMCYAALTKGTAALYAAVLTAAQALGLAEELRTALLSNPEGAYQRMERQVPGLSAYADRYVGEMEEIAATMEQVGLTPYLHRGAAELYRFLSQTPLAQETPESIDRSRTMTETVEVWARCLPTRT